MALTFPSQPAPNDIFGDWRWDGNKWTGWRPTVTLRGPPGPLGPSDQIDTITPGISWTLRSTPVDNNWQDIAYGNGLFVVVSSDGVGRMMTSPDGVDWTLRNTPETESSTWNAIIYANNTFIVTSTTNAAAMTSPDGINWTIRTVPSSANAIAYDDGRFVTSRMFSLDNGATWTATSDTVPPSGNTIVGGNGMFVIMGTGSTSRVSLDGGVTWTYGSQPNAQWQNSIFVNGLFVAVNNTGTSRVGTSVDPSAGPGSWTSYDAGAQNMWAGITYGNGLFVAVATTGTERAMTSPDGMLWTLRNTPAEFGWRRIAYGNNRFVAIANSGVGARVMTSP